MNNQTKIAVFFGGKITQHLVLVKKAARKSGVDLRLISYNRVYFDTTDLTVKLRPSEESRGKWERVDDFEVLFFRTTGKHWEEVDLIINSINPSKSPLDKGDFKKPVVVDPMVEYGKPSYACKAWQMLKLQEAGIEVPKTVYGSLWFLYETMKNQDSLRQRSFVGAHAQVAASMIALQKKPFASTWGFPVIIKGSGGDRGTRVFKADNLEELEKLVRSLRKSETEEGKRYMLQEYIENNGDYRVLVLGKKVLGVMKRSRQMAGEFRNNYSAGGIVEVADLPEGIKQLAVKAADVCGLWVAGVDVAFRDNDFGKPVIWEVNKGPQFKGFMKATGIDVPAEIVKFLVSLNPSKSPFDKGDKINNK